MKTFLELLKEKIVVFDGAMGSNLQAQNRIDNLLI
jgi:methionine synthase I (cobalamin-dependent)